MQSDSIAKLADALAKARAKFHAVKKTKEVRVPGRPPYFYAPLDAVYEAVLPALAEQGISVVHQTDWRENVLLLVTKLIHVSGESIEASMPIPSGKMQEMGSALTYGKRYQVSGLLAIAAEDDDDAQGADAAPKAKPGRKPEPKPEGPTISPSQAQAFFSAAKLKGLGPNDTKALVLRVAGVEASQDILVSKYADLMAALEEYRAG